MLASGEVLLVRYEDTSAYDGQDGWFLPDGYLVRLEHPDDAARRVAREQVGLAIDPELAEIESFGNGDWHLIFHYRAEVADPDAVTAGSNIAASEWFPLRDLPPADEKAHGGWPAEVLARIAA